MTERRAPYADPTVPIEERGTFKLFNRFESDAVIREYMRDRYGATDIKIIYTGGGKLAGPMPDGKQD